MLKKIKIYVKKDLIPFFRMLFYNTVIKSYIMAFGRNDNRILSHRVSLCLIFKNEAPFLKEWLDYHLCIGVDHFYLYNNNSDDNYREVLEKYIKNGFVTLIDFPYQAAQFKAYKDCYTRFRNDSNWICFLDADEFICPISKSNINDWINDFSKWHAINVQWVMFGTGGVLKHNYSMNVIEQYFSSQPNLNRHGKCFVNTRFDIANWDTSFVHHHTYMKRRVFGVNMVVPAVNQFKYRCTMDKIWGGGKDKLRNASIQINHYFTKSWDIYSAKMHKTDVFYKRNPKESIDYFYKYEEQCASRNYTILRFLIRLKRYQKLID